MSAGICDVSRARPSLGTLPTHRPLQSSCRRGRETVAESQKTGIGALKAGPVAYV